MVEENVRKGNVTVKGKEALKWRLWTKRYVPAAVGISVV
jgi:hypothetical protein